MLIAMPEPTAPQRVLAEVKSTDLVDLAGTLIRIPSFKTEEARSEPLAVRRQRLNVIRPIQILGCISGRGPCACPHPGTSTTGAGP